MSLIRSFLERIHVRTQAQLYSSSNQAQAQSAYSIYHQEAFSSNDCVWKTKGILHRVWG